MIETDRSRLEREYFEALYADSADPWRFETSPYEREKYDRTLEALGERRFGRGLEVGCSIGVLTARLAARCDELVAVDISARAAARARARLDSRPNVRIEQRRLPEELPGGDWDLVLCSEVLYYWDRATLEPALDRFAAALRPGGSLLAVHWRLPTRTYPLGGDEVHDLLAERLPLRHAVEVREERYRLDRYDREPA